MTKRQSSLDKVFVNRTARDRQRALFNRAMTERWSYAKFKKVALKK